MMVSTKGRYALRVMIDLAQNAGEKTISLRDIAQRQEISLKYLEAVMSPLHRAGLVISQLGKSGGYRLSKATNEYCIGDILRTTENFLVPVSCLGCEENTCERADECITLPMWTELNRIISEYLDDLTLQDLLDGNVKVPLAE